MNYDKVELFENFSFFIKKKFNIVLNIHDIFLIVNFPVKKPLKGLYIKDQYRQGGER